MAWSSWSAAGSPVWLVVAGGVEAEVAHELVVAQDRGVVFVDDDGDGAADPFGSDVDAGTRQVDSAAGVDDRRAGFGSGCRVSECIGGWRGSWRGLPT